jgi:hypothetical protein
LPQIDAEWGHPIIGPRGERGRVPLFCYKILHQLGIKKRYSIHLSELIYEFMDPALDALSDGVRRVLGPDLAGPSWCVCHCKECGQKESDIDHTREPTGPSADLHVDQILRDVRSKRLLKSEEKYVQHSLHDRVVRIQR